MALLSLIHFGFKYILLSVPKRQLYKKNFTLVVSLIDDARFVRASTFACRSGLLPLRLQGVCVVCIILLSCNGSNFSWFLLLQHFGACV